VDKLRRENWGTKTWKGGRKLITLKRAEIAGFPFIRGIKPNRSKGGGVGRGGITPFVVGGAQKPLTQFCGKPRWMSPKGKKGWFLKGQYYIP